MRLNEFSLLIVGIYLAVAAVAGWFANDAAKNGVHVNIPAIAGQ